MTLHVPFGLESRLEGHFKLKKLDSKFAGERDSINKD